MPSSRSFDLSNPPFTRWPCAGAEIRVATSARSFLHNQVNSMVGSLKLVGEGKLTAADLASALDARDRARCGPVAPPRRLYLVGLSMSCSGHRQHPWHRRLSTILEATPRYSRVCRSRPYSTVGRALSSRQSLRRAIPPSNHRRMAKALRYATSQTAKSRPIHTRSAIQVP